MNVEQDKRIFSVIELANLMGCSRFQMARLLDAKGVKVERIGKKKVVLIWDLKEAFPNLWSTITMER